jgi:Uma2 family endonuclease
MTAQELYRLPGINAKHAELVRGVLRVGEPSGMASSASAARISAMLTLYTLQHDIGVVTGESAGYRLQRDPDTLRAPDVAFVRKERLPERLPRTFVDVAPDLAVEVLPPSDSRRTTIEKIEEYLAAGTRLVWLVDLDRQTVTVYRPNQAPEVLDGAATLSGEDVLPGFQLAVASVLL